MPTRCTAAASGSTPPPLCGGMGECPARRGGCTRGALGNGGVAAAFPQDYGGASLPTEGTTAAPPWFYAAAPTANVPMRSGRTTA